MSAYLFCASPRSGSTLLCDMLWQTGVAGKPHSYFRQGSIGDFARYFGLHESTADTYGQAYIDAVIAKGRQQTGTFGLRTMWDSLPGLVTRLRGLQGDGSDTQVLERAFGACRFIHLSREDKIAQAVSLAIAEQTGLWHRNADGSDRENFGLAREASYNADQITREFLGLQAEHDGWSDWFAVNGIHPHRLTYETLAADPIGRLRDVLAFLGLDLSAAHTVTPGTQRLASDVNRDWAARYRRAHGLPLAATAV